MKRVTMELGGHAPAIVFGDADIGKATTLLSAAKFRNAGQVCVSPTRFLVHETLFDGFVDGFVAGAKTLKVGDGLDPTTRMGPLAHARRIEAMEGLSPTPRPRAPSFAPAASASATRASSSSRRCSPTCRSTPAS